MYKDLVSWFVISQSTSVLVSIRFDYGWESYCIEEIIKLICPRRGFYNFFKGTSFYYDHIK